MQISGLQPVLLLSDKVYCVMNVSISVTYVQHAIEISLRTFVADLAVAWRLRMPLEVRKR